MLDFGIAEEAIADMVVIGNMDDAIVGFVENSNNQMQLVYDYNKILDIFVKRDNMTYEEAMEFVDFNFHFPEKQKPLIMYSLEESR